MALEDVLVQLFEAFDSGTQFDINVAAVFQKKVTIVRNDPTVVDCEVSSLQRSVILRAAVLGISVATSDGFFLEYFRESRSTSSAVVKTCRVLVSLVRKVHAP